MYATRNRKLAKIYEKIDDCHFCRREKNNLQHVLGVGDTQKPRFALILINPTHLNISSHPDWDSYRFPFIGVRHFWKVFQRSGIIPSALLDEIYKNDWSKELLEQIIGQLSQKRIYLTNLVKCTKDSPKYPSKETIAYGKSLVVEELRILRPKNVICFGLLTFWELTGRMVKLGSYYEGFRKREIWPFPPSVELGLQSRIFPCYFPAGRGNPARAAEMLGFYLGKA